MADPPRLVAKTRCQMGQSEDTAGAGGRYLMMKAILKTWPATPVGKRRLIREVLHQAKPKLFHDKEQPGSVGHLWIAEFRLRNADWRRPILNTHSDAERE